MFIWSPTYQQSVFKRYHSNKHFSRVFTHKMAAKINRHRYETKLRHCHSVYKPKSEFRDFSKIIDRPVKHTQWPTSSELYMKYIWIANNCVHDRGIVKWLGVCVAVDWTRVSNYTDATCMHALRIISCVCGRANTSAARSQKETNGTQYRMFEHALKADRDNVINRTEP